MKRVYKLVLPLTLIILLILHPEAVAKGTADAFQICINVLLPSLFPFFVLSKMFIAYQGDRFLGRLLSPVTKCLFKICGSGGTSFLLGIISGYPVGGKTAVDLYRQGSISHKEAENLICFSNNSGPLFIISAIGLNMLSSKGIGIFLYIIHILSATTLGIFLRFRISDITPKNKSDDFPRYQGNTFTACVEESMSSLIKIFAYVIFFGAILNIVKSIELFGFIYENKILEGLFYSIFEITNGIKKLSASEIALSTKLILISFILGWSGFSIHFQTKSVLDGFDFSFPKYILAKLIQGIIASVYAYLALIFVRFDKSVFISSSFIMTDICQPGIFTMFSVLILIIYITLQLRLKDSKRY